MGAVSAYRKKAVSRIIRPFRTANRYQKMHNDISQSRPPRPARRQAAGLINSTRSAHALTFTLS